MATGQPKTASSHAETQLLISLSSEQESFQASPQLAELEHKIQVPIISGEYPFIHHIIPVMDQTQNIDEQDQRRRSAAEG